MPFNVFNLEDSIQNLAPKEEFIYDFLEGFCSWIEDEIDFSLYTYKDPDDVSLYTQFSFVDRYENLIILNVDFINEIENDYGYLMEARVENLIYDLNKMDFINFDYKAYLLFEKYLNGVNGLFSVDFLEYHEVNIEETLNFEYFF